MTNPTSVERTLKFTVVDVDRNRRHHTIGFALYPLKPSAMMALDDVIIQKDLEREGAEVSCDVTSRSLNECDVIQGLFQLEL